MPEQAVSGTRDQARLQQLALTCWELEQAPPDRLREPAVRRRYLRVRQQLLAEQEAAAAVAPKARSRLLVRDDSPAAVLLIHGSTGQPADLQGLADSLHGAGLTVWNLRLPGHGTPGSGLPGVTWRACYNSAVLAYENLARCHQRVHLIGFSFGAALAAIMAPKVKPTTLCLLSPALIPQLPWRLRLLLWLRAHKLPWLRRRFGWDLEVLAAMEQARSALGRLRLPVYAAHCQDDERISPASLRLLQRRVKHPAARFRLFPEGGHMILQSHGPGDLYREIQEFLRPPRRR